MTSEEKAKIRRRWKRWLDVIGNEIGWLLTSHDIFDDIQKIVKDNVNIQSPGLIYRWITVNYSVRVSVTIRRLTDRDKRTISLYRLIQDISQNPHVITRDYFVSKYSKDMQELDCANSDFNHFANKKSREVSQYKLQKDMNRLLSDTKRIRTFTDKWIAHFDTDRRRYVVPTYLDVSNALQDIDRIYCRYCLLLTCSGLITRKPALQYDWKEPLRHPWIEMSDKVKNWRLRQGKAVWDKRESNS